MSPHPLHALAALMTAGAALFARWAVGRPRGRRRSPSAARPPWRRTAPAPARMTGPQAAVWDAETYVHSYWKQLRARPDQTD